MSDVFISLKCFHAVIFRNYIVIYSSVLEILHGWSTNYPINVNRKNDAEALRDVCQVHQKSQRKLRWLIKFDVFYFDFLQTLKCNFSLQSQLQKRVLAQPIKCTFCEREFKTEGWLKNHIVATHSLPVSIPLNKLPKPLPVRAYLRKSKSWFRGIWTKLRNLNSG